MAQKRITDYEDAGHKMQLVIDYCARHAVVPRKDDDPDLTEPWTGVSTETVQEGVRKEFGEDIGNGTATYTWQRLGADHDVNAALSFLKDRRKALLDTGLEELAAWKP
ncbi:hypothetical protein [Natrinema salinisoli]|uniref:hypothetical protein n=1 Tax=Natrinema salinisoli TaxID=2878535 RepID=UPI001CF08354|nr:hypothetical protein [Natrinema salinisoli]